MSSPFHRIAYRADTVVSNLRRSGCDDEAKHLPEIPEMKMRIKMRARTKSSRLRQD